MSRDRPAGGILVVVAVVLVAAIAVGPAPTMVVAQDQPTCEYPLTVTDATGTDVTITEAPDDIVTLAPSAAQTVWAIGARERVVGLSMHSGFLDGADERTNVSADPLSIDLETVVDLDPDLVLAPNVTPGSEVEDLREIGLTVYHFDTATSVEDILDKTALTGELVGACEGATETVASARTDLDRIKAALPPRDERPEAYFTLGDGYTPGSGTFQHDAIERAGLRNLAAEAGIDGWESINEEVVVDRDPEWILHTDAFPEPPVGSVVEETTAMQADQVVSLDANRISQPAPQLVDAIATIHEAVYGPLETPTPTATPTATTTATPTETPPPSPTDTPATDGVPGFHLLAAVLALAAVALAGRARHR
ncbi:MAG: PGF-CTERM-anchored ABC transporter substrate-binding protein [Halobacteriales archaeon]